MSGGFICNLKFCKFDWIICLFFIFFRDVSLNIVRINKILGYYGILRMFGLCFSGFVVIVFYKNEIY